MHFRQESNKLSQLCKYFVNTCNIFFKSEIWILTATVWTWFEL